MRCQAVRAGWLVAKPRWSRPPVGSRGLTPRRPAALDDLAPRPHYGQALTVGWVRILVRAPRVSFRTMPLFLTGDCPAGPSRHPEFRRPPGWCSSTSSPSVRALRQRPGVLPFRRRRSASMARRRPAKRFGADAEQAGASPGREACRHLPRTLLRPARSARRPARQPDPNALRGMGGIRNWRRSISGRRGVAPRQGPKWECHRAWIAGRPGYIRLHLPGRSDLQAGLPSRSTSSWERTHY